MARPKGLKKNKHGLPDEVAAKILAAKPKELSVEHSRELVALDILREQVKADPQISQLKSQVDALTASADELPQVVEAHENLENIRNNQLGDEYVKLKLDLKALRQGWNNDLKDRRKKIKFMMKTLKTHMESGALKSEM